MHFIYPYIFYNRISPTLASSVLCKPNPLNFLIDATSCNRNPAYSFPTWLPDWSFTLEDPAVRSLDTSIEQAATAIVANPPAILECRSVLSVLGFRLGDILRISIEKDADQDSSVMIERVREWEDFVNAATEIHSTARLFGGKKHKTVAERSTNFQALLRTIFTADGVPQEIKERLIYLLETVVCGVLMKWDNDLSNS
jgi:hypothetical protein